MFYDKTNPDISLSDFRKKVAALTEFKSLTGKIYKVNLKEQQAENNPNILHIVRETNNGWIMDLEGVLAAYKNLIDFKTKNFAPYVKSRTHSPSLGLLLSLKLLT